MPRLPEITAPNSENQAAYDYLMKTRGAVRGGFAVTLVSPEITQRMAHVGTYARFDSPIDKFFREVAATVASAELENPAEYVVHARQLRQLGVSEAVVQAILDRAPVKGATEDQMIAINLARELTRDHKLSDASFQAGRKRLGDAGVVDLIATVGYYAMLAVVHVALDIAPPK
jgi:4-carboxymuconolactone decarboxylase